MSSEQTPQDTIQSTERVAQPAKLRSRLLAIAYDFLIIIFVTTILVVIIELILVGNEEIAADGMLKKLLKAFWFVPGFLYLGHYWTKYGQTPSMKIWKIKVVNKQGLYISWPQALKRYVFALLGLGLFWVFFNKGRLALQDVLSNTYLIKTDVKTDINDEIKTDIDEA